MGTSARDRNGITQTGDGPASGWSQPSVQHSTEADIRRFYRKQRCCSAVTAIKGLCVRSMKDSHRQDRSKVATLPERGVLRRGPARRGTSVETLRPGAPWSDLALSFVGNWWAGVCSDSISKREPEQRPDGAHSISAGELRSRGIATGIHIALATGWPKGLQR